MKNFAFAFLLPLAALAAPIIHFEKSIWTPEGSSWGTDDSLERALHLENHELPELFKQALKTKNHFLVKDVSSIPLAKGRFVDSKAFLYSKLHICWDKALPQSTAFTRRKTEELMESMTAKSDKFSLKFIKNVDPLDLDSTACDVLVMKGSWSNFPYAALKEDRRYDPNNTLGKIFGLYYRHSELTLPIITLHPDMLFDFSTDSERPYVVEDPNGLSVDGNVIFLHELGHVLGLDHIHPELVSGYAHPETSLMGKANDIRSLNEIKLRFNGTKRLARFLDIQQVSIYRNLFAQFLDPICSMPGEDFDVAEGMSLEEGAKYIKKTWAEKYGQASADTLELSDESMREYVRKSLWSTRDSKLCSIAQNVVAGVIPEWAQLEFASIPDKGKIYNHIALSFKQPYFEPRMNYGGVVLYVSKDVQKIEPYPWNDIARFLPWEEFFVNLPRVSKKVWNFKIPEIFTGDRDLRMELQWPNKNLWLLHASYWGRQIPSPKNIEVTAEDHDGEILELGFGSFEDEEFIYPWFRVRTSNQGGRLKIHFKLRATSTGQEPGELLSSRSLEIELCDNLIRCI